MKNNEFNPWNTASKSLAENLISAIECIVLRNYQAIIKYIPNSEQANPLKKTAHELDNPFSWTCGTQFHRTPEELEKAIESAHNETEKDLLKNWTPVFGEIEAFKIYQETGIITPKLLRGVGTCSQVRKSDLIKYLKETGESERAKLWEEGPYFNSGIWTPRDCKYWEDVEGMTYAVYFKSNDEGLSIEELYIQLDESIKAIINK